jgi:hypothetical protein
VVPDLASSVGAAVRAYLEAPTTNYPSSSGNGNEITNTTCPSTPSPKCDTQKSVVETPSKSYGGLPSAVSNCKFSRRESTEYYANNSHHKNGFSYLVLEAFYSGYKAPNDISKQDLDVFMHLALLVKKLSIDQCEILGELLELLLHRYNDLDNWSKEQIPYLDTFNQFYCKCSCSSCKSKRRETMGAPYLEIPIFPAIPQNVVEIQSKIRDGQRSLFNILLHPVIRKMDDLADEHVYILPSDCIQHFLAQGITPLV